ALWAMGRPSRYTAKNRNSPDIAVVGFNCSHLHFGDPGGLGSATGSGEDGSRSSSEAYVEDGFKSGSAIGRAFINPAGDFRGTTADANHPRSGDRRPDCGLSRFHPGLLWL